MVGDLRDLIEGDFAYPELQGIEWDKSRFSMKLNDSSDSHTPDSKGLYIWIKLIDSKAPVIEDVLPVYSPNEPLVSPSVKISGKLTDDSGIGVDWTSLKLWIDRGKENERVAGYNQVQRKDSYFHFQSNEPYSGGAHEFEISIADKNGNEALYSGSFYVNRSSFNPKIGILDVQLLSGVGAVMANKLNSTGVLTINDLANRYPIQLSQKTGITIRESTIAIQRARLACTQTKFEHLVFDELADLAMKDLIEMTNDELIAMDVEQETLTQVENLRQNIVLLYICLDSGPVKNMKLKDFV